MDASIIISSRKLICWQHIGVELLLGLELLLGSETRGLVDHLARFFEDCVY